MGEDIPVTVSLDFTLNGGSGLSFLLLPKIYKLMPLTYAGHFQA